MMYRIGYVVAGLAVMAAILTIYAVLGLVLRLWDVPMIVGPIIGAAFAILWTHRRA